MFIRHFQTSTRVSTTNLMIWWAERFLQVCRGHELPNWLRSHHMTTLKRYLIKYAHFNDAWARLDRDRIRDSYVSYQAFDWTAWQAAAFAADADNADGNAGVETDVADISSCELNGDDCSTNGGSACDQNASAVAESPTGDFQAGPCLGEDSARASAADSDVSDPKPLFVRRYSSIVLTPLESICDLASANRVPVVGSMFEEDQVRAARMCAALKAAKFRS